MKRVKLYKDQKKMIKIRKSGRYVVELLGQGAEVEVVGRFKGEGQDKIDIEIVVVHKAKNTKADVNVRGVVLDRASARVVGTIKVDKKAANTNSFLTEKILMMSDKSRAEAIPNLEIKANEVKCSHAAVVATIDEEQLFYLMSRGLKRDEAEKIIIEGFLR